MNYLSVRWKIILLAGLVLGVTSALFIWQQHKLQLREFETDQISFRERSRFIVEYLFESQAERIQVLANLLIAPPTMREDILNRRADRLAGRVEEIATELSFDQGVSTVVFHDAEQAQLAVWGDPGFSHEVLTYSRLAVSTEKPQTHILCQQTCVQQTVIPVSHHGRTIATVAIISNLESILNDLHRLSYSDVAVLKGQESDERAPLAAMRLVSASGGATIRAVLDASRRGVWSQGHFEWRHENRVHQVVLIPMPLNVDGQTHFAVVPDVTDQMQLIDLSVKNNLLRGFSVLALAMLLLYVMLRPTMRRIGHVSHILPLLGQEKFTQVREDYAVRPRVKWLGNKWLDEVDELEGLALALAAQLERLKAETSLQTDTLHLKALELKHERDFISGLLETAPVLILSYTGDGIIQLANKYAMQCSGLTRLVGRGYSELFLGRSQDEHADTLSRINAGEVCRMESRLAGEEGTSRDVLWFHTRLVDEMAEAATFLSVGMDITEHKANEIRIHNLAFYDSLTKLPNRRLLNDYIQHAMAASARNKNHCALAFIDLDHFKSFNDTQGQAHGDRLLIEMAGRLRVSVREFDTVAHLSGDEFVILLEELGEDALLADAQVRLIGEKLRSVINQPYLLPEDSCQLTCSVGICLFSGHEASADELLRHANIAMSHAKTAGRNVLRFFDPAMQSGLEARSALHADLRHALSLAQFRLFYQVQTGADGKPLGAEVLLRWFHPERGMVSPLHFIPLAEESELILPIGLWVLQTACAQIKVWEGNELTCQLQIAVNVSARQFQQPNFVEQVLQTLEQSGADPARLKLELTESMVLNDINDSIEKMLQLKALGVSIAIDDFGTAYSSLSYLTQLPLDQLKIDQSFVRNIGIKSSDAIIVQTIINMANNLDMQIIAEGVETQAQLTFLQGAGCLTYQGYLFSKPLELNAFMDYLAAVRDSGVEGAN